MEIKAPRQKLEYLLLIKRESLKGWAKDKYHVYRIIEILFCRRQEIYLLYAWTVF